MTEQTIGTAVLYLTADTSNMEAGVERAKKAQDGLGVSSDRAAQKQEQNSKRQIAALERRTAALTRDQAEMLRWDIAQRTSGETAARLNAQLDAQVVKLRAQAAAVNTTATAFNKYGLSAKQQAAALRGVPAQVTDIFTSLASGQRPITVLLQQGGQLKDLFGGIVPAARALGGAVAGLINPFTVAAGAAAALFFAWKQGNDEAVGFRQALALTGNVAGVTADEMQAMALSISQGIPTQHQAAQALAEVAKSGKFTGEQLREVAEAALLMEKATGQAIATTVSQFAKLRDDPVKAVQELNDTYHFLTLEVYEQIKALQAQGREEEALNLAISESSKALSDRANDVVANASYMERAWRGLGSVVRQVWDDIRNAGRDSTKATEAQMKIASANSSLNAVASRIKTFVGNGGIYTPEREKRDRAEIARLIKVKQDAAKAFANDPEAKNAQDRAAKQRANEAAIRLDQEAAGYASAEDKLRKRKTEAIGKTAEAVRLAKQAGDAKLAAAAQADGDKILAALDKQIADIEQRNAKAASGGGGGGTRSSGGGRSSAPRELPALDTTKAQEELGRLAEAELRATESFRDLEAQLQGPMAVAIRDHERRVAELNALAAQSPEAANRLSAALELEAKRHADVVKEIDAYSDPMKLLLEDMQFELDLIGKSNAERAVMIELRRQNVNMATAEGKAIADSALEAARAFEKEAEAKTRSIELMDEFRSGASNALADIVTGAKSAKEAFADFFNDLAARITQMIAEKWIEKAFGAMGSDGSGTSGGGWLAAIAGLFANAKGNAFDNGQVQAFATGGVINGPTLFPMQGRVGLMGEAGPEAIMPLHRGPDGKLGVRAETTQAPAGPVSLTQVFNVQGAPDRRTREQMARTSGREARRGMTRTG